MRYRAAPQWCPSLSVRNLEGEQPTRGKKKKTRASTTTLHCRTRQKAPVWRAYGCHVGPSHGGRKEEREEEEGRSQSAQNVPLLLAGDLPFCFQHTGADRRPSPLNERDKKNEERTYDRKNLVCRSSAKVVAWSEHQLVIRC